MDDNVSEAGVRQHAEGGHWEAENRDTAKELGDGREQAREGRAEEGDADKARGEGEHGAEDDGLLADPACD